MKKLNSIIALAALAGLSSCSNDLAEELNGNGNGNAIVFENTLTNNSTRTSITGSDFKAGTAMEVYGFQTTGTEVDQIFKDQTVNYDGGTSWSYSPIKYWNDKSSYEFYGAYPQGDYEFDNDTKNFTIKDFTVKDAIADQIDLMIAEKNTTTPGNTVTMNFNHILSQINFYAKISKNMQDMTTGKNTGVVSGSINSLTITGLKNKGTFTQNSFNSSNNNVEGAWSDTDGSYTFPTITTTPVDYDFTKAGIMGTTGNIVCDLLMVPQPLTATLSVDYTLVYADGTKARFTKDVPLESIKFNGTAVTSWNKNTIYNYIMELDPSHKKGDYSDAAIDPDGSDNGDATETPDNKLVGPDKNGDYSVDTDGDGVGDIPVVWEDVDGDGKEEAGVDKDGDGHIDNVDGEDENHADTDAPGKDEVSDGDPINNPDGKDVILIDTDGDGKPDSQLEKDPTTGEITPKEIEVSNAIVFSAEVETWDTTVDPEIRIIQ